jgi:UDP-N-acetylglucosamine 2-epimerase (non-hydrolysing)/UDP-GlcNAc3NAcA epimerase
MKIATIVGARPQFIKAATLSRILRQEFEEVLIHTGQHYAYNMSDIFFKELDIPQPNYNLGISGGTHGEMTGQMLIKLEKVLQKESPDMVLIYGDTNSTLAAALAAVKLHIPVCHVEAGTRLGTLLNPEEVNRIIADDVSTLLMCCTKSAVEFLRKEGKTNNVFLVGDPMYDAFIYYSTGSASSLKEPLLKLDGSEYILPYNFYYMTCHREENTANDETLKEILNAMNTLEYPCIYPVHPRNQASAARIREENGFDNIILCQPVGYLSSIFLVTHAAKIVTDSGGLQREAYFAGKQCVTIFDYVVWPETMTGLMNQLAKPDSHDILEKLNARPEAVTGSPFGDGHAAEKIVKHIKDYYLK